MPNSIILTCSNINHKSLYSLGAGFCARSVCSTIMLPITLVKTRYPSAVSLIPRMEFDKTTNNTIFHTFRNVMKGNGRGLFPALYAELPSVLRKKRRRSRLERAKSPPGWAVRALQTDLTSEPGQRCPWQSSVPRWWGCSPSGGAPDGGPRFFNARAN